MSKRKERLKKGVIWVIASGWIPILIFYFSIGIKVKDDNAERRIPDGINRAIYGYFDRAIRTELQEVSIYQCNYEELNLFGGAYGGFYDPVMERIVYPTSYKTDRLLVHEFLHHVWFKNLVPDQEAFVQDFERLLQDQGYKHIAQTIQSKWESVASRGEISALRATELYCYLGDWLISYRSWNNLHPRRLPEYMQKHYQGILHPYFVRVTARDFRQDRLDLDIAEFIVNGELRAYVIRDRLTCIMELMEHGGEIAWDSTNHGYKVSRVGTTALYGNEGVYIARNTVPLRVRLYLGPLEPSSAVIQLSDDKTIPLNLVPHQELDNRLACYAISWDDLLRVYTEMFRNNVLVEFTPLRNNRSTQQTEIARKPSGNLPLIETSTSVKNQLGISDTNVRISYENIASVQTASPVVLADFVLENNFAFPLSRIDLMGTLDFTSLISDKESSGIVLVVDGNEVASVKCSDFINNRSWTLSAWGFRTDMTTHVQIRFYGQFATGAMMQCALVRLYTDVGGVSYMSQSHRLPSVMYE